MKWLVTGIDGFAGHHFFKFIKEKGIDVFGTTRRNSSVDNKEVFFLDLTNKEEIFNIVNKIKPTHLALIAGFSSQRDSFDQPELCLKVNYDSAKYFLEAIKENGLNTKILLISSAMVYCPSIDKHKETSPLCNTSPYVDSKLKMENLIKDYPESFIVCSRSFNHTGVGQKESFIVPLLAKKFALAEGPQVELSLGDIDSKRDFLDVKDVCNAYYELLTEPSLTEAGKPRIFNVCSSKCTTVREMITILEEITQKKAKITPNPKFLNKKNERPILWGDNSLIVNNTNWRPTINLNETIKEIYNYYKRNSKINPK